MSSVRDPSLVQFRLALIEHLRERKNIERSQDSKDDKNDEHRQSRTSCNSLDDEVQDGAPNDRKVSKRKIERVIL